MQRTIMPSWEDLLAWNRQLKNADHLHTVIGIMIGEVFVAPRSDGYVWLTLGDGEAKEVEESKLAAVLEKLYRDHP